MADFNRELPGSWRASLRGHFITPSRHGVNVAWTPAGKSEGWRDYAEFLPELREYNEKKKAMRSLSISRSLSSAGSSSSKHARSRSSSPDNEHESHMKASPGLGLSGSLSSIGKDITRTVSSDSLPYYSLRVKYPESSVPWRMSYRAALSARSERILRQQSVKHMTRIPILSGMATFTFRNRAITSLHGMGVHPDVTTVFMQQNFLTSFEGWEHQPVLKELQAADNLIESFKGLAPTPTVERLVLVGNPIAQHKHYRLMATAAFGKFMRMLDNEPVTRTELERALSLGKAVGNALRSGWILDDAPNPDADIDLTLEEYLFYDKYGVLVENEQSPDDVDGNDQQHQESRFREGSENGHEKFQAKELGLQSASHTVAAGNDSSHLADMRCQDCEEEGLGMDGAWCVECAMMLCRQCATFHLKSKRTRNHRLQTIEQENKGENLDRELAQAQERNDMFKSQVRLMTLQEQVKVEKQMTQLLVRALHGQGGESTLEGENLEHEQAPLFKRDATAEKQARPEFRDLSVVGSQWTAGIDSIASSTSLEFDSSPTSSHIALC